MQEWHIDVFSDLNYERTKAITRFLHNGKEMGTIETAPQLVDNPEFAFVELAKLPHRWCILPNDLHFAMTVYRREALTKIDYREKTFRFVPAPELGGPRWKLTTDKSDLRPEDKVA